MSEPNIIILETEDLTGEDGDEEQNKTDEALLSQNQKGRSNFSSGSVRDRNRCRSRSRDRNDRFTRNEKGRPDRRNAERKSKWDNNNMVSMSRLNAPLLETPRLHMGGPQMVGPQMVGPPMVGPQMVAPQMVGPQMVGPQMGGPQIAGPPMNAPPGYMRNMNMIPGMTSVMQYPQMVNNIMAPQMEGPMAGMHNMNMVHNMLDQNMMMINQGMPNQPIFISCGILLPPIPGIPKPQKRDKPKGCRTVFVGGFPHLNFDVVHEIFQKFGTIEDIRSSKGGLYYIRYEQPECVELSFTLTGYRFKFHEQNENEATSLFIDYALNPDDQKEYERQHQREESPPRVELFSPAALSSMSDKIKSESEFVSAARSLVSWLERGVCNKMYANTFYSLIQASNNQVRRLFNEKIQLDEEMQNMKTTIKDKYAHVLLQFEYVAKILSAAKHQRVSDHFSKQQRRNIEMWLKMTEEVENIKEEFYSTFEDEDMNLEQKVGKNTVSLEQFEELKKQNKTLTYELEGYKNEVHLAKNEAEMKFEKFKDHFIAQQTLQSDQLFRPSSPNKGSPKLILTTDDKEVLPDNSITPSEAQLISILTAFLLVHPLGASLDYLVSYVRSMTPNITQATVLATLQKYTDIFNRVTTGVGACIEHRWMYITFDTIKRESSL